MNGKPCPVCGQLIDGRPDRKACSRSCKQELKRQYDVARYPLIRQKKVDSACSWQRNNVIRKQQYDAEYRKRRPEERLLLKREYGRLHPKSPLDMILTVAKRRATKERAGIFRVTDRDLRKLRVSYGNACFACRAPFTKANPLEWDHVIPICRGGRHSIGNLLPSCRRCNRNKHIRFLSEWRHGRVVSVRYFTRPVRAVQPSDGDQETAQLASSPVLAETTRRACP